MPWQTKRPRPVPSPTGLVVKKGSKMRASTASGMPGPVSSTSTTTVPPSRRARTRSSWPALPASIACTALTSRLRNTCARRASMARMKRRSSISSTTVVRPRASERTMAMTERSVAGTSTTTGWSFSCWRENERSERTMVATRSQPTRMSSSSVSICAPVTAPPWASCSMVRADSTLARIHPRGLLISWAMPAASVPSEASRSWASRRARIARRSVTSTPVRMSSKGAASPSPIQRADQTICKRPSSECSGCSPTARSAMSGRGSPWANHLRSTCLSTASTDRPRRSSSEPSSSTAARFMREMAPVRSTPTTSASTASSAACASSLSPRRRTLAVCSSRVRVATAVPRRALATESSRSASRARVTSTSLTSMLSRPVTGSGLACAMTRCQRTPRSAVTCTSSSKPAPLSVASQRRGQVSAATKREA